LAAAIMGIVIISSGISDKEFNFAHAYDWDRRYAILFMYFPFARSEVTADAH